MAERTPFLDMEWIARTQDVTVRINTLPPRGGTPWHFHSAVTDNIFCLEGEIAVESRDPDETARLAPGGRVVIPPRRVHRVVSVGEAGSRYLLVQATGPYDFHAVTET